MVNHKHKKRDKSQTGIDVWKSDLIARRLMGIFIFITITPQTMTIQPKKNDFLKCPKKSLILSPFF